MPVLINSADRAIGGSMSPAPPWAGMPDGPVIMGILNITPDSFSDGGDTMAAVQAIRVGRQMIADGAQILDIGGESTRPGATPVSPEEEQSRILPVITGLAALGIPLSVDTRNAATMAVALDAGATIVNDISALAHDPAASALVASRGCPVVLMHMRGTPATMREHAAYGDVMSEVFSELAGRIEAAETAGIKRSDIAVDPGIGFAKNAGHNIILLQRLPALLGLGCRIVVGASRKNFIGVLSGAVEPKHRDAGSIATGLFALTRGATVLRVHDVAGMVQAVRVWRVLVG